MIETSIIPFLPKPQAIPWPGTKEQVILFLELRALVSRKNY